MSELDNGNINRLYNPELMTEESRLAWERIPPLFAQNTELIRTVAGSADISAHFKGSTLIGVGGTRDQASDIDVVFYTGEPSPDYDALYLTLCKEVYSGFADDSPVEATHKAIMKEMFQEEHYRISTLAEKLPFEDTFHVKLDGTIVSMDGLLAQLQSISSKIERNENRLGGISLTQDEFQAVYSAANFLGSPSIFESTQGQDSTFRNRLLGVFLGSAQGRELYSNAIQPTFDRLIVNYEDNYYYRDNPAGLQRHRARVANAFDQVFERRQIPLDQQDRVARLLRLQRRNIGLPDYEQLHLEPSERSIP